MHHISQMPSVVWPMVRQQQGHTACKQSECCR